MNELKTSAVVGSRSESEGVAIIGMACRFPGADSLDAFWRLLVAGRRALRACPAGRWSVERFLRPGAPTPGFAYTFAGGYLDDPYAFDPAPFGVSPREAQQMDPQQRLLLEIVWHALEDAALHPSRLSSERVGVYVGASTVDYQSGASHDPAVMESHFMTGNSLSIIANRISYALDLKGPSLAVDSACSSSVAALSLAVRALQDGEIDAAIVGGVNLLLSPAPFIGFSQARMLSPSGRSAPFSQLADGYVRAEGGAVIVLRRESDALARGERIRSVVLGVATNSDGRTAAGISVPSAAAQKALIAELYGRLQVAPADLAFVEAHGTGTKVGDPIEATAIGEALGQARARPLPLGAVKANIGHLEAASGIAGLVKASLALEQRVLPASPLFGPLNETIDFDGLNLAPAREAVVLDVQGPLFAGVCNYGFGGTNAHVVLRSADPSRPGRAGEAAAPAPAAEVLCLSAASRGALRRLAGEVASAIEAGGSVAEMAAGLAHRRELLAHRWAAPAATNAAQTAAALRAYAASEAVDPASASVGVGAGSSAKLAFVFSGNGSQFADMGRRAYAANADFRREIDAIDDEFRALSGWSLRACFVDGVEPERLEASSVNQPLLYALQSALAAVLAARGVQPALVLGHSVGEVAAAEAAGALTRSEAIRLVYWRSRRQEAIRGQGRMLVVGADEATTRAEIAAAGCPSVVIAALNSPSATTVAGPTGELRALADHCRRMRLASKDVGVDYPFHSPALDPIRPAVLDSLAALRPRPGHTRLISTVTGAAVEGEMLSADYWWRNVREPVRFEQAVRQAIAEDVGLFVEIGPRPLLGGPIADILRETGSSGQALPTLGERDGAAEGDPVLVAMARLVAHGAPFDPAQLFGPAPAGAVDLPAYPFDRQDYNLPSTPEALDAYGSMWRARPRHPLLGARMAADSPEWRNLIDPALVPYFADHRVQGNVIVPAAALIDMAFAAARDLFGAGPAELDEFDVFKALSLGTGDTREISTRLSQQTGSIEIWSRKRFSEDGWVLHARGLVRPLRGVAPTPLAPPSGPGVRRDGQTAIYAEAARAGLEYGELFRVVAACEHDGVATAAEIAEPAGGLGAFADLHVVHPIALDAAFHALFISRPQRDGEMKAHLPVRFRRVRVWRPGASIRVCLTRLTREMAASKTIAASLIGEDGSVVASIEAAVLKALYLAKPSASDRSFHAGWVERSPLPDACFGRLAAHVEAQADEPAPAWLLLRAFALGVAHRLLGETARQAGVADIGELPDHVPATLRPLIGRALAALRSYGAVQAAAAGESLPADLGLPAPEAILATLLKHGPEANAELRLAAAALGRLSSVCEDATPASAKLLARTAGDLSLLKPAADALADAVAAVSAAAGRRSRLLVVGPWSSSLETALWPALASGAVEITVLDDSASARPPGGVRVLTPADRPSESELPFDALVVFATPFEAPRVDWIPEGLRALADRAPVVAATVRADATLAILMGLHDPAFTDAAAATDVPAWLEQHGCSPVASRASGSSAIWIGRAPARAVARQPEFLAVIGAAPLPSEWTAAALRPSRLAADLGAWLRDVPAGVTGTALLWVEAAGEAMAAAVAAQIERVRQALLAVEACGRPVRLFVAAQAGASATAAAAQAAVAGFIRVAINEFPGVDLRLIEFAADAAPGRLAQALADPAQEREWIVTRDAVAAKRIARGLGARVPISGEQRSVLRFDKPGRLDGLVWRAGTRGEIGPDDIEIEVAAVGLNYRDVLVALGAIDEDLLSAGLTQAALGFECAGVVARVGAAVVELAPGDRVMGFAANCFASHLVAPAANFFRIPDHLSLAAAATIPVAFVTAWHALVDRANLQPGEDVLVHGAAGAVGLAALQIAALKGARPVGTASSVSRRALAMAAGGVAAFPSRDEAFVEPVERLGGVDVVLNSLAGSAMKASLRLVRPFGRFIELGKRDYLENTPLELRPFVRNLTYAGVDVDELLAHDPRRVRAIMTQICDLLARGELSPLPHQIYEGDRLAEAFRSMQASDHVGKIVCRPSSRVEPDLEALEFRAKPGAYLIVGGGSGLGFATAQWLARRGAATLVLASRRGAVEDELQADLDALHAKGIDVRVEKLDVTDFDQVCALVTRIESRCGPLRGVVHAAVVLDDGLINGLSPQRLQDVLAPKIDGLLNLDRATQAVPLDFFVAYSSATTLIGSPGQGAYVAANAFLEGFMRARRARGLPGLAIGWGAISDVGLIARDPALGERLRRTTGVAGIPSAEALAHLGRLLASGDSLDPVQYFTNIGSSPAAAKLALLNSPGYLGLGLAQGGETEAAGDLLTTIRGQQRSTALVATTQAVRREAAQILRMAEEQIDPAARLSDLGLDSLMALELHLAIERLAGVQVPMIGASDLRLADVAAMVVDQVRSDGASAEDAPSDLEISPERTARMTL